MSVLRAVKRALDEKRVFEVEKETLEHCPRFDTLLTYLPRLFAKVDDHLFDGAIKAFLSANNIKFDIQASTDGPAGITTYNEKRGMCIKIRRDAWQTHFPALVGGRLCDSPDACLIHVFLHEMVHVLLFCIYLQLEFTPEQVTNSILSHYDPTHNVLFTMWLEKFFGQHTINNSLLLHSEDPSQPLVFEKSVLETERVCIRKKTSQTKHKVFHKGKKCRVVLVSDQSNLKPHHSRVRVKKTNDILIVPNGLLFC